MNPQQHVTDLLVRASAGDRAALDEALPFVYAEMRRLAHRQLGRENQGHTLNTTALVHEAYLRVVDQSRSSWSSRSQFLALAATSMRRILVDHARRRATRKRGSAPLLIPLERAGDIVFEQQSELIVALDDALGRLAHLDARQARLVEYRFFGGFTEEEAARLLGIGLRTAKRDWARARTWLYREIHSVASP